MARPFKPMTLALAAVGVFAAGSALLPPAVRPVNVSVLGALGLFAFARLPARHALLVWAAAIGLKELGAYLAYGFEPYPLTWLGFALYGVAGYALLRRTESPLAVGGAAVGAGLLFFLVTNFGAWLEQALPYGYTPSGLLECYRAAIPFHRGTLLGDLVFAAGLLAAHAALSRAYFPAERVAADVAAEPVHPTA